MSRFLVNLSRRFYRVIPWLLGLASVLLALGGTVLAAVYWWFLPHIADYRTQLAAILSRATGYEISIGSVSGEWQGARPRLEVSDLDIRNSQGQALLHIGRADGRFGWLSFLLLRPRFYTLNVYETPLVVRRVNAGLFYVGGLPVHVGQRGNGAFRDWLLDQGHLRWVDGTVTWVDQMSAAPALTFSHVNAELRNILSFHRFTLTAQPPAALAGPLQVQGQFRHVGFLADKTWSGSMTVDAPALALQGFRPWLPNTYAGLAGRGSAQISLTVSRNHLAAWNAKVILRGLVFPSQGGNPLQFYSLSGDGGWKRTKTAVTWYGHGLSFQMAGANPSGPLDFVYTTEETNARSLKASGVDLAALAPLAAELPADWAMTPMWQGMRPTGRVDTLDVAWSGPAAQPQLQRLAASFRGLSWLAWKNFPGITGLSGNLQGVGNQGSFRLQGGITLNLANVMSQPRYEFSKFQAHGGWEHEGNDWTLTLGSLNADNPDLSASLTGTYRWSGKGPGWADLHGNIARAEASAVWRYIPSLVNADVTHWLHQALLAGVAENGDLVLRGNLADFPFADGGGGEFRVSVPLQGVRLRFADAWPALDGIGGALVFQGKDLGIRVQQGRFGAVHVQGVDAEIADLSTHDAQLDLHGTAVGPAQDMLDYINASPVANHLQDFTRDVQAVGNARLELALQVPLGHAADTNVQGAVRFEGNKFTLPRGLLAVDAVRGTLNFTTSGMTAHRLNLRVLGGPATLEITSREGVVNAQAQGWVDGARAAALLGKGGAGRLQGRAAWSGVFRLGRGENTVQIDSSLLGLGSTLPAPLGKASAQSLPLRYKRVSRAGQATDTSLGLGTLLSAQWQQAPRDQGGRVLRGALAFNVPARLPSASVLQVSGRLPKLDLQGWQAMDLGTGQRVLPPLSISGVRVASLDFLDREFHNVALSGGESGDVLRVNVRAPKAQGVVSYRKEDGTHLLGLDFSHLDLPRSQPGSTAAPGEVNFSRWPVVNMTVGSLVWKGLPLGQLVGKAHPTDAGMSIDQLRISNPDAVLDLTGQWRQGGQGLTSGHMQLEIHSAGRLLARLGYPALVQGGRGSLDGDIAWSGQPQDFALKHLGGTLNLDVRDGQFLKVNPGVGKLLGIISLQSLERRLSLNFRDLTERGFAFDHISATMRIAEGVVYTDNFAMQGPAARVSLSGLARLNDETVQLRLKIYPHLSESLAVAGAVAGGPLVGLGTLLAQKILSNPLEALTSQEYMVSGPWGHPDVTRPDQLAHSDKDSAKP